MIDQLRSWTLMSPHKIGLKLIASLWKILEEWSTIEVDVISWNIDAIWYPFWRVFFLINSNTKLIVWHLHELFLHLLTYLSKHFGCESFWLTLLMLILQTIIAKRWSCHTFSKYLTCRILVNQVMIRIMILYLSKQTLFKFLLSCDWLRLHQWSTTVFILKVILLYSRNFLWYLYWKTLNVLILHLSPLDLFAWVLLFKVLQFKFLLRLIWIVKAQFF